LAGSKAIIFDLFGTLITTDSDSEVHESLSKVLAKIHSDAFSWEEHLEIYSRLTKNGMSSLDATWEALLRLLRRTGLEPRIGKDALTKMHADLHAKHAKLAPGALNALRKAKRFAGYVGLLTDGDGVVVDAILKATGIKEFFDAIVTFDDCGVRKPDPCLFRACLRKLSVNASNAVMIGDRCVDVEGSIGVGMKTVLLNEGVDCSVEPDARAGDLLAAVDHALVLLGLR